MASGPQLLLLQMRKRGQQHTFYPQHVTLPQSLCLPHGPLISTMLLAVSLGKTAWKEGSDPPVSLQ
ncbi:hypothetical protein P7K49_019924 [Saguinus oedipus]|uniref:Uncharacterized protein n=1 Tax=Saguinus oedipus TaxID=9490 RepID=A0ABQ9UYS6_SAGOE|nr:hypothetical protein P7K49_019924 [Saguinus oedipus]